MIRARSYRAGDAGLIDAQPGQSVEARLMRDVEDAAQRGLAYTMVRDDRPVACGGIIPLWHGFAHAWGLAAPLDARLGVAIRAQVRAAIATVEASVGRLRRIEATARADFPAAQVFLTALGFERVVLLKAYGPDGGDYWLYQRLAAEVRA